MKKKKYFLSFYYVPALIGLIYYFMTIISRNVYRSAKYYVSYKIYFMNLGIGMFKHIFSY